MNLSPPQIHRDATQSPDARVVLLQVVKYDKRCLIPIRSRYYRGCWSGRCAHAAPVVVRLVGTAAIISSSILAPGARRKRPWHRACCALLRDGAERRLLLSFLNPPVHGISTVRLAMLDTTK